VAPEPFVVAVVRGDVVEARHRVHAVAVHEGRVVEAAGDPELLTYFRSSAKPLQALPLVRLRPDLDDTEIAIACASHLARPEQLAAVRSLLERADTTEDDLECGPEPTRLEHNCSGKHAGFLLVCRERGWPTSGYRLPEHPLQRLLSEQIAAAAEVDAVAVPTGVDGCGVVTWALPLDRMANAFARLPTLDGGGRTLAAMRAHPALIRGPLAGDVVLMRTLPGWTAKGGAEGLLCAVSPDGVGIALKAEDGSWRALRPAVAELLRRLGHDPGGVGVVSLENSRHEVVGELVIER
jgi:L-asparaginase II